MQMRLPILPRVPNPLLQDALRLLDKLAVQINRIAIHPPHGIVLPKDIIGRLLIVRLHHTTMALPFFRQLVRGSAVVTFVGLV